MRFPPPARKLVLAIHLTASVGWVGAVAAYASLDLAAATSDDPGILRASYMAMGIVVGSVIVPMAIASLLTGVLVSLGTKWGLIRHWWVTISLVLTVIATAVLLVETGTIGAYASMAADPATSGTELRSMGSTLVHSIGGGVVLLTVLVLNVFKPRGLTPYGWRKQQAGRQSGPRSSATL